MRIVNIHEAKTHLSRLLEQAVAGEEILIARAGKPIARLIPYRAAEKPRQPGLWQGQVVIGKDFDSLPDAMATAFGGGGP
jgi:prevent-host-death family protein